MSLKAKLEAVIYAAEEPVTLAQLAALFSAEALEWKAEQEAASAAASAEEAAQLPEPLLNAEFDYVELEQAPEAPVEAEAEPVPAPEVEAEAVEAGTETVAEPVPEQPAETPVDAEAEAKRLARQQDREVRAILRGLLDELIATYASDERGIEIKEIAGGFRLATKPEYHDGVRMFVKSLKPALKLSLPALETLAVIAYKQPVTAPEVNEIRGVDSSGVFGSLLARKLISTAGRKQVIGRPILYKTTKEFLLRFGLKDLAELPSMEEFEKIAQLEFEGMEPTAEGSAAADVNEDPSLEVDGDTGETAGKAAEMAELEGQEAAEKDSNETAATAGSEEAPAAATPDNPEPVAGAPAVEAGTPPAEAAPAAPSSLEQAEIETVPHD